MDYAELKEEMKNAMKAKDKDRLAIIRQVKGDVDATVKDEGRDEVAEQDVTASLKRTLKQARETHEASVKAGTDEERTQRLAAQIEILEGMLPAQLGGEQLEALVAQTIEQMRHDTELTLAAPPARAVMPVGGCRSVHGACPWADFKAIVEAAIIPACLGTD